MQGLTSSFTTSPITTSSFTLESLYDLVVERAEAPADKRSYTQQNLQQGIERLAQKLGEEATETLIAALGCKNPSTETKTETKSETKTETKSETKTETKTKTKIETNAAKQALCEESADLLYHLCLLWYACDTTPQEVCAVLEQRSLNKTTHRP